MDFGQPAPIILSIKLTEAKHDDFITDTTEKRYNYGADKAVINY